MSQRTIAITGASGKTGFRIAEELTAVGDRPRLLVRSSSVIPESLVDAEHVRLSLQDPRALDSALEGVDALVIATEWAVFRSPDFIKVSEGLKEKVVFDGRNLYDLDQMKDLGFYYNSIGRRTIIPQG